MQDEDLVEEAPKPKKKQKKDARGQFVLERQPNWLELFLEFISHLTIDSKDTGVTALKDVLFGSQKRFLAELIDGLERDIHEFYCLKARQLGCTSISLAIDLFWLVTHPGMQGALVCDTEGNRNKFRVILTRYLSSLPRRYRVVVKQHNRDSLVLENGSVLDYLVAGATRRAAGGGLGRSRAYNFLHATEVSSFANQEGMVSLFATLSEVYPDRLYIFESTAKGFNLFWQMYQQAVNDPITKKNFFVGWWAKESYSVPEGSELFKRYWDGDITVEEQAQVNKCWEKYGVRITPQQLAWYRWKQDTTGAAALMAQEFPWDEDEAFLSTGNAYFPPKKMGAIIRALSENPPPFRGYAYELGESFMLTKVKEVRTVEEAQLKIYEEPSEYGEYVIGVDPAYGRNENQDQSVIQVCRCYADRLVQVAEFCSISPDSYQVAWPLAHLIGCYRKVMTIIEITGPGEATVLELKHLRELFDAGVFPQPGDGSITDIFGNARWYMYHRADSPGAGFVYNWKTSGDNKMAIMTSLRDSVVLGGMEVRSIQCALEMQGIVQKGFVIEPELSTADDDRVLGLAFAHRAWCDWVRPMMIAEGRTWENEVKAEKLAAEEGGRGTMVSHIVSAFFQGKQDEREEKELEDLWK